MDTCEIKNGSTLVKQCEEEIHTKKYIVRETEGYVLVWFHADEKLREKPYYEPFVVNTHLEYRGESINFVNCHIQDIPENGADLKHFFYVHTYPLSWLKCLKFKWKLKWSRGDDPDLLEKTRVEDPVF